MRLTKKLISMLLTAIMLLGITGIATAAGTNSIKINNAQAGETYSIYKIIDIESHNAASGNYSYKLNSEWNTFFTTGAGKDYITVDTNGYVSWVEAKKTDVEMAKLAVAASAETTGKTQAATAITPTATGTITFSSLDAGYYLITSTQGTKAMIATTPSKQEVSITEKNPTTTVSKKVLEDSTNIWGSKNSAQLGDPVEFSSEIVAKKGAKNFVYHDIMDDGLTLDTDSITVTVPGPNQTTVTLTKGTDYTVATAVLHDPDGNRETTEDQYTCTFEVRFTQAYLNTINADTTITVGYTAILNENATPVATEYNKAMVTWGNNSHTEWVPTETNTYKFSILKYDAAQTDTRSPLAGAEFKLYNKSHLDASQKPTLVKLVKLSDTEYRVATAADESNQNITVLDKFVTVKDAEIVINGVDLDQYELEEIKAPPGYNLLGKRVAVTVADTNTVKAEIANRTGTELPATGGMGTTLFYVFGSGMFVLAGIMLVSRRRMAE